MQQKTTAEGGHNLKSFFFCRPVTLTDSSTPTFIHLFSTLLSTVACCYGAHSRALRPLLTTPQISRMDCLLISECVWRVEGENGDGRAVRRSVAGEFLLTSVSRRSTIKLDLLGLSRYISLSKMNLSSGFVSVRLCSNIYSYQQPTVAAF